MNANKKVIIYTTIIIAGFSVLYFIKDSKNKSTLNENKTTSVYVDSVSNDNLEKYKTFSGTLMGIKEETISSQMPSTVKSINVKKGDKAKKGQVLMVLDSSSVDEQVTKTKEAYDLASASAKDAREKLNQGKSQLSSVSTKLTNQKNEVSSLTKQLNNYKSELEKLVKDKENKLISEIEFLQKSKDLSDKISSLSKDISEKSMALSALEMEKAGLEKSLSSVDEKSIDSQVNQVKKAYDSSLEAKESFTLKAPFDGIVTTLNAKVNEMIPTFTEPIIVSDISSLSLEITVSDKDINLINKNTNYKLSLYDKNGKTLDTNGSVYSISSINDNGEKKHCVKIKIPNKENFNSGSFAQIYIPYNKNNKTLVISKNALFRNNEYSYVYIVDKENKVKKVNVTLGIENDDYIEILDGLNINDKVITAGKDFVSVDEKVNIVGGEK